MDPHESGDDAEEFLAQFDLPPSSIEVDWDTLLSPGGWKCPSDQHGVTHDIEDGDSSGSNLKCDRGRCGLHSSSMASDHDDKVKEYMPDKALLRELGYSDNEDDDPEWTDHHLLHSAEATAEAPPSEPAYTAVAQPKELNPAYLSVQPSERLCKLVNNQMVRLKHSFVDSSEHGCVSDNTMPLSKSFSEVSRRECSPSKASSSLLRRPSSEPIRKVCSHPPANFVVSPSCPYFGLVPSHVEIEMERRHARRAEREPRIDRVFMDELHNMWTERRKTRHMAEEVIQGVISSATQRLEADLQGVVQPPRDPGEVSKSSTSVTHDENELTETTTTRLRVEELIQCVISSATQRLEAELQGVIERPSVSGQISTASTRVDYQDDTQQAGADSSEVTKDESISSPATSAVIGSKIAAMRQLLEQQMDKNPLLSGPSSNKRAAATFLSDNLDKDAASTAVKQAGQKKITKTVSPGIMKVLDQLSAETVKKDDVSPTSRDTAIEMRREAFRHLRKRMVEKGTLEAQRTESKDSPTEKIPEDMSVADIRKQLEAKMAEEGDKTVSGKGTLVLPRPLCHEESAGDSNESFPQRKTYLDKKHVHDTLEAKDENSSQTLSKTCYESLDSSAKITPLSKSSRSLPDTRSLTKEALQSPQSAISRANTHHDDGSVRKTVFKLEQDTDKKTDRKEDVTIPRRQSSETSEMLLKLQTTDDSEPDVVRKRLSVQTPEGCVRDTVDNIEKLRHQQDQSGDKVEGSTVQKYLDPDEVCVHGAVSPYMTSMVRRNVLYWLFYKIYSLGMRIVGFVNNYLS
ncbi:uncharacterized protein [Branchiostoma lanceolatum]|uniref:uncharacterized protein n=1 Tax=Branchiostoma lanceolatum TaxID=7740 RepID=UPI0034563369